MITQEQAEAVVLRVINEPSRHAPDRPTFVITRVEPNRLGWLFYYQSEEYVRTGELSKMYVGHGPVLVSSDNGAYVETGSAPPLAERVAEAERQLASDRSPSDLPPNKSLERTRGR
jgi:hypothetical protein